MTHNSFSREYGRKINFNKQKVSVALVTEGFKLINIRALVESLGLSLWLPEDPFIQGYRM